MRIPNLHYALLETVGLTPRITTLAGLEQIYLVNSCMWFRYTHIGQFFHPPDQFEFPRRMY